MPRTGQPIGRPKSFDRKKTINVTDELLARIEAYREAHALPSEAEAIRQLLEQALTSSEAPKAKRKRQS